MQIYFTASITGGRALQPQYAEIVKMLKKYGTVFSDHVADEQMPKYGETHITKKEIYEREVERLKQCDVVVAEVTTPSLGVGCLVTMALSAGKRVLCLYSGENTYKLTAMIEGAPRAEICAYQSLEELERSLSVILSEAKNPLN